MIFMEMYRIVFSFGGACLFLSNSDVIKCSGCASSNHPPKETCERQAVEEEVVLAVAFDIGVEHESLRLRGPKQARGFKTRNA